MAGDDDRRVGAQVARTTNITAGPWYSPRKSSRLSPVRGWILESTTDPAVLIRMPRGSVKTLGRTARADFIVDAALVSRVHCRLTADGPDGLTVEDLGSTNGTLVNGAKVARGVLKAGDTLTVGRVEFRVQSR